MKKIFIIVLAAAMMASCKSETSQLPKVEYKTMELEPTDVTVHVSFAAKLKGENDVDVFPQANGTLMETKVVPGQRVTKGQPMFVIDQVPSEAAVRVAEANLKVAKAQAATSKINLESKTDLFTKNIVSEIQVRKARNEYETSLAMVEQAEAGLVNARQNLSFTVVKAPCNGIVGSISYNKGTLVGPMMSKPLTTVSDNSVMKAMIAMTERAMLSIADEGAGSIEELIAAAPDVRLKTSLGKYYPEPGRIKYVSGVIDSSTGTMQVIAFFPNKGGLLRSGGSAKVEVPVSYKDVLVIPQAATYELQDKVFAYKVVDNKAKSVEVKVASLDDGQNYAVLEGLKPGDVIIADGAGNVKEGEEVSYQMSF